MIQKASRIVGADIEENTHIHEDALRFAIDVAKMTITQVLEGEADLTELAKLLEEFEELGV